MKKLAYLVITVLLLAGCAVSTTNDSNTVGGSLILNLESELSRTIEPSISMQITSYDITASGPDSETFSNSGFTGTTLAKNGLGVGAWTITINAKNIDNTVIATATDTFSIAGATTTDVNIIVAPITGKGSLQLDISWPETEINTPVLNATLTPVNGSSTDIIFNINANSATYPITDLSTGYYTLNIQLLDDTDYVWGIIEAVRIINGEVSLASFDLTVNDLNLVVISEFGNLNLSVVSELQNPIELTFTGNTAAISSVENMTVTVNTSITPDSYQWYLNGSLVPGATNSSITIGFGLSEDHYRLDVVVQKGFILSSGYITFDYSLYSIGDIGPAGGWIFYDKGNHSGGWRYLEMAPDNVGGPHLQWGTNNHTVTEADGIEIGTGQQNTLDIIEGDSLVNNAANSCANYTSEKDGVLYSDWYLPSKDELSELYDQLYVLLTNKPAANLYGALYWSSTEKDDSYAWIQYFHDGYITGVNKENPSNLYVLARPIRSF